MDREANDSLDASLDLWLRTRDPQARDEVCRRHDWMSVSVARRFRDRGEQLDDLIQVARIGLLKAIDRFDTTFETPFGAYATVTMVGELRRHFRDTTWHVHVPRRIKDLQTTLRGVSEVLTHESGRPPTIEEIAERAGLTAEQVIEALDGANAYRTDSLDGPAWNQTVSVLDRMLSTEPSVETRVGLSDLLNRLSQRDRKIIELRFFEGWSQSEIADHLDISQVHVSRLLRSILGNLRAALHAGDET